MKGKDDNNHKRRTRFAEAVNAKRRKFNTVIESDNATKSIGVPIDGSNVETLRPIHDGSNRVDDTADSDRRNGGIAASGSERGISASGSPSGRKRGRKSNGSRSHSATNSDSDGTGSADRERKGLGLDVSVADDVEATLNEQRPRRKRRTKAQIAADNGEVEPGVTASALLIGGLIQGLSETLSLSFNEPVYRLNKSESTELGGALFNCLDALPKSARKQFDKIFQKYYPFWNLAVVAAKIGYPRYQYIQLRKAAENAKDDSSSGNTQNDNKD